ncbi:hypothetical protein GOODEAATRI_033859 [Goodea atripinnis]|uniref:Uncharacterized protein n=1 Tax=Goodea atripinnis TaxID=208336 RepID=A0ABV0N8Q6_9TELE
MCHDTATADKFYVRHLNMEQSLEIRRLFEEATHGASAPAPSLTSLPEPKVPAKPRSEKRKRRVSVSESSSSEEAEVPYQESGSSALEEEMEQISRAKRRLAKKRLVLPMDSKEWMGGIEIVLFDDIMFFLSVFYRKLPGPHNLKGPRGLFTRRWWLPSVP